jgi:hypothetical protein
MIKSDGSTKNEVGYSYHNINMKALPMDLVPEVNSFASEFATEFKLPDNKINIGVDLIVYKDGNDSIGWHDDDTQGKCKLMFVYWGFMICHKFFTKPAFFIHLKVKTLFWPLLLKVTR